MDKIKSIIGELDSDYLRRNYIIGGSWGAFFILSLVSSSEDNMFTLAAVLYFSLCIYLFPFAAYVWDGIVNVVLGDTVIFLPLLIMLMWKTTKVGMLFTFAVFVAPLGIVYLLFQQKKRS